MKKLLIAWCLYSTMSFASEPSEFRTEVTMSLICGNTEYIMSEINNEYGEEPVAVASGQINDIADPTMPVKLVFWQSADESTWSATITPAEYDYVTCYIATGTGSIKIIKENG